MYIHIYIYICHYIIIYTGSSPQVLRDLLAADAHHGQGIFLQHLPTGQLLRTHRIGANRIFLDEKRGEIPSGPLDTHRNIWENYGKSEENHRKMEDHRFPMGKLKKLWSCTVPLEVPLIVTPETDFWSQGDLRTHVSKITEIIEVDSIFKVSMNLVAIFGIQLTDRIFNFSVSTSASFFRPLLDPLEDALGTKPSSPLRYMELVWNPNHLMSTINIDGNPQVGSQ